MGSEPSKRASATSVEWVSCFKSDGYAKDYSTIYLSIHVLYYGKENPKKNGNNNDHESDNIPPLKTLVAKTVPPVIIFFFALHFLLDFEFADTLSQTIL